LPSVPILDEAGRIEDDEGTVISEPTTPMGSKGVFQMIEFVNQRWSWATWLGGCLVAGLCLSWATDANGQNERVGLNDRVLPELPMGLTSFGAARTEDAIYLYGGHTGQAHSYWNTSQSNQLLKWDLTAEQPEWELVAEGQHRLQGLAMVAHGERLILVGGFFASNQQGEPHSLHSQDQVSVYNLKANSWEQLPSLPQGRSSHDAMVLDDTLYVVGGWFMDGPDSTVWHDSAHRLDLTDPSAQWQELPQPGFHRRALALAAFDGKLYAVGGMAKQGGPTREVSIYDPLEKTWRPGPELVGDEGMVGFGAAAFPIQGRLVVTAYDGSVQVLSRDASHWMSVGETQEARFFHRMLPLNDQQLVSFGGANMEIGKFLTPEIVPLKLPQDPDLP